MLKFRPDELKSIKYPRCVLMCVLGLNGCDKLRECELKLIKWKESAQQGD